LSLSSDTSDKNVSLGALADLITARSKSTPFPTPTIVWAMYAETDENVGHPRRCLGARHRISAKLRLKLRIRDEARVATLVSILHNCAA
jgi:hypothetical protein